MYRYWLSLAIANNTPVLPSYKLKGVGQSLIKPSIAGFSVGHMAVVVLSCACIVPVINKAAAKQIILNIKGKESK
jgi:hypothetical protein